MAWPPPPYTPEEIDPLTGLPVGMGPAAPAIPVPPWQPQPQAPDVGQGAMPHVQRPPSALPPQPYAAMPAPGVEVQPDPAMPPWMLSGLGAQGAHGLAQGAVNANPPPFEVDAISGGETPPPPPADRLQALEPQMSGEAPYGLRSMDPYDRALLEQNQYAQETARQQAAEQERFMRNEEVQATLGQQREVERQQRLGAQRERIQRLNNDILSTKLEPRKASKVLGFGEAIGVAISAALGGLINPGKPNEMLKYINDKVQQDLETQRANLMAKQGVAQSEENLYGMLMRELGDERAAEQAFKANRYQLASMKLSQVAADRAPGQMAVDFGVLKAGLDQQRAAAEAAAAAEAEKTAWDRSMDLAEVENKRNELILRDTMNKRDNYTSRANKKDEVALGWAKLGLEERELDIRLAEKDAQGRVPIYGIGGANEGSGPIGTIDSRANPEAIKEAQRLGSAYLTMAPKLERYRQLMKKHGGSLTRMKKQSAADYEEIKSLWADIVVGWKQAGALGALDMGTVTISKEWLSDPVLYENDIVNALLKAPDQAIEQVISRFEYDTNAKFDNIGWRAKDGKSRYTELARSKVKIDDTGGIQGRAARSKPVMFIGDDGTPNFEGRGRTATPEEEKWWSERKGKNVAKTPRDPDAEIKYRRQQNEIARRAGRPLPFPETK